MSDTPQYGRTELAELTPEQITEAHEAGYLRDLLRGETAPVEPYSLSAEPVQYNRAQLRGMSAEDVETAYAAGSLRDVLNGVEPEASDSE